MVGDGWWLVGAGWGRAGLGIAVQGRAALKPSTFPGTNLLPGGTYRDVYVNSVDFAVPYWAVLPSPELRARWAADGPYTEPMDTILPFLRDTVCFGPK